MTTYQVSLPAALVERSVTVLPPAGTLAFGAPDRAEPWQRRHVLGTAVLAAIGAVGIVVCWYVGAGKLTYDDQLPWLVGSIASAGVVVLGGVYWLVCGFRQVILLESDLMRYLGPWLREAQAVRPSAETDHSAAAFVVAPGMRRAHRPHCLLARGKRDLQAVSGADLAARGLSGCGACGT